MFCNQAGLVQVVEKALGYFGALIVGGATELVKIDMEPVINLGVFGKVVVTQLPWGLLLLKSSCLGGSTILVSTADIEGVVPAEPAEPGEYITGKHLDKVAQVWNIVYIW